MKKLLSLLLAGVMAMSLLAGCADETPRETTSDGLADTTEPTVETQPDVSQGDAAAESITMAYYPDRGLNPYTCMDYTNRALLPLVYQGLFSMSADHQVYPILCQRYTVSEDMTNHVFYLEKNARFSDGSPVTAADVAASLNAAEASGYYEGRFSHIDSISAAADGAVLIQTDCAYEDLSPLLDIPVVKAGQTGEASPIGSGPFVMLLEGQNRLLKKNPSWWCGEVPVLFMDTVQLVEAESPRHIRDMFEFSNLDLVCADPGTDTFAAYRNDYELWDCETGIFLYLGCNLNSSVFSNRQVRQALPMAINREKLLDDFYRGFGWEASLPASPKAPSYSTGLAAQYDYDGAQLTNALASTKLKGSKIVLLTNSEDSLRTRVAEAIAEMLRPSGLEVEVKACKYEDFLYALRMKEYDLYLGQTRLPPNMDLTEFLYEDGFLSFGPMNDKTMYALNLQALENSGNFYDLYQTIMNDGRLTPILFRSYAIYAARGGLSELKPARDNIFFYELGRTMEDALSQPPVETTAPAETSEPEETTAE